MYVCRGYVLSQYIIQRMDDLSSVQPVDGLPPPPTSPPLSSTDTSNRDS